MYVLKIDEMGIKFVGEILRKKKFFNILWGDLNKMIYYE